MASLTYTKDDYYLAGVFDGEGTIGVYHGQTQSGLRHTRVSVRVAMTDHVPIDKFQERFGGTKGCYRAKSGKLVFNWYVCGTKCKPALEMFASLCHAKHDQAQAALEIIPFLERTKPLGRGGGRKRVITDAEDTLRLDIAQRVAQLKRS